MFANVKLTENEMYPGELNACVQNIDIQLFKYEGSSFFALIWVTEIMVQISPNQQTNKISVAQTDQIEEEKVERKKDNSNEEIQANSSKNKIILISIGCFVAGACIALVIGLRSKLETWVKLETKLSEPAFHWIDHL